MTSAAPRRRLPEAILRRLSSAPAGRTKTRRLRGLARGHVVMLIVDDQGQVSIRRGPGRIDILEHIVDEVGRRFGHLFQEEKAPLTEEERRQLNAGGVALRAPRRDMAVEGAGRYAEILSTSLSVPEVAKILGVNTSRVRQRLIARTLYGIKTGGEWRVPSFHFHGGREVPGLRAVASSPIAISAVSPLASSRSSARRRCRSAMERGRRETAERPMMRRSATCSGGANPRAAWPGSMTASISPPPAG